MECVPSTKKIAISLYVGWHRALELFISPFQLWRGRCYVDTYHTLHIPGLLIQSGLHLSDFFESPMALKWYGSTTFSKNGKICSGGIPDPVRTFEHWLWQLRFRFMICLRCSLGAITCYLHNSYWVAIHDHCQPAMLDFRQVANFATRFRQEWSWNPFLLVTL